jgi:tRNA threonylcarbamoyl adenosine modification protein YeaZ
VLVLALDTATPATTAAVVCEGQVLAERRHVDARAHAEVLAPMVADVLAEAGVTARQLDAVGVGVGPGAYTGLRVGLVTALAVGHAVGVPVHGMVTLDVLAAASGLAVPFAVVTDARRREVFVARYDGSGSRVLGPDVMTPAAAAGELGGVPVVGAAGTGFADRFADVRGPELPSAGVLGRLVEAALAAGDELLPAVPVYLRRPDVTVPGAPKPVSRP